MPDGWVERELVEEGQTCWLRERRQEGGALSLARAFAVLPPPERLYSHLRLVYRIGPWREARLVKDGINNLWHLARESRWRPEAQRVLAAIAHRDLLELSRRGAGPFDLLAFFRPEEALFLDLETCGLSSTQPLFLVGVAFAEGADLVVRQYLARSYEEEAGVLKAVAKLLPRFSLVFSYNGRSFDHPFLRQRSLIVQEPLDWNPWHVDLLFLTRRRFGAYLPDCRLFTVSRMVLGQAREDDLPGSLVPELYHRFVAEGDWLIIEPVLRHNDADLMAMIALFQELASGAAAGPGASGTAAVAGAVGK